MELFRMF